MEDQQLRFLGVVAHPHDFTHFAGTCGVHTALGDDVTVVCMTAGAGTHNVVLAQEMAKPPEERDPSVISEGQEACVAQKEQELRSAAALFGVTDVRMLGYPDKPFTYDKHPEAATELADIIREVRPHVMITQSPYRTEHHGRVGGGQNDHVETGVTSVQARAEAANAAYMSDAPLHKIAAVLFPGVYFNRDEWDFTVDIGDWHRQRVQAEEMYKSQGHTPEFARKRIEISVGAIGWSSGTSYAEAFVRDRPERLSRIAVSEEDLGATRESESDHISRISAQ